MKSIKLFFTWLFFPLLLPFKKRQANIKTKIKQVELNYDSLIEEYYRIQRKESSLSRSQRDEVILRINFLILKGHIKAG